MAQLVIFLAAQQDAGEDIVDFATVGVGKTNHHLGEEVRLRAPLPEVEEAANARGPARDVDRLSEEAGGGEEEKRERQDETTDGIAGRRAVEASTGVEGFDPRRNGGRGHRRRRP